MLISFFIKLSFLMNSNLSQIEIRTLQQFFLGFIIDVTAYGTRKLNQKGKGIKNFIFYIQMKPYKLSFKLNKVPQRYFLYTQWWFIEPSSKAVPLSYIKWYFNDKMKKFQNNMKRRKIQSFFSKFSRNFSI